MEAVVTMPTPKEKATSVGAVPRGGPLLHKKKPVVVLFPNGIRPTECSNGMLRPR